MWLLWTLLWILVTLLALGLLLLLVPTWVRASGQVCGLQAEGHAYAAWGYFVVRLRVCSADGLVVRVLGIPVFRRTWAQLRQAGVTPEAQEKKSTGPEPQRTRNTQSPGRGRFGLRALWRVFQLARDAAARLWATLRFRGQVSGQIGLGDPADTANVALVLELLARNSKSMRIEVEPNWVDEVLELQGSAQLVVWPIHTLLVVISLMLNREFRTAFVSLSS